MPFRHTFSANRLIDAFNEAVRDGLIDTAQAANAVAVLDMPVQTGTLRDNQRVLDEFTEIDRNGVSVYHGAPNVPYAAAIELDNYALLGNVDEFERQDFEGFQNTGNRGSIQRGADQEYPYIGQRIRDNWRNRQGRQYSQRQRQQLRRLRGSSDSTQGSNRST